MFRNAITSVSRPLALQGARALHSTPVASKTVTEKVSEVADKVNKSVGKGLASAIDKGENVAQSTKEVMGSASQQAKEKGNEAYDAASQKTNQATEKGKEASNTASHKANQAAAGARQASEDFKKEVRK
ncbi:hypothetical protein E1B28_010142 [Marasmius oreades]|uniref:Uncharacterized protein n=1 Tax=Marasmius oreades TaxID=181124 RepID=A0A9P7RXP7_9AGAR|nr:uncharacterized protein E1B28_010142 [Marasmius oreades]KAG7091086.1 hypothetical protein E1B28_010142 [Marasmius oreades]